MVNYRRNRIPGGTYFFTVNLRDRHGALLTNHIDLLRQAFRLTKTTQPFHIDAIVVLPDHLHTIWTLPDRDTDYSGRWRAIKANFIRQLIEAGLSLNKNTKGEYAVWQRRYWEHTIRDDKDFRHHVDYIHFNPVKHGHTVAPSDWPYSSIHRFINKGVLPRNWGSEELLNTDGKFGE